MVFFTIDGHRIELSYFDGRDRVIDPEYIGKIIEAYNNASTMSLHDRLGIKPKKRRTPIPDDVRLELENERGTLCESCKYYEYDDIHHIDGDPTNNDSSNLSLLCAKCHRRMRGRKL